MDIEGVNPAVPSSTVRSSRGKEMSARIGIGLLLVVLAGCMFLVGWTAFTRS